jgi:UDP-glucose 4-epimerase
VSKRLEALHWPQRTKAELYLRSRFGESGSIRALYSGQQIAYNLSDGNFYDKYELGQLTKNILNVKTLKFHLLVNFVKLIAGVSEKISSLRNTAPILNLEKLTN